MVPRVLDGGTYSLKEMDGTGLSGAYAGNSLKRYWARDVWRNEKNEEEIKEETEEETEEENDSSDSENGETDTEETSEWPL